MFNEEQGAGACIDSVITEIEKIPTVKYFIAVNDGSKDNTLNILQDKQKKYRKKLVIVNAKKNGGYGKALQLGIQEAVKFNLEYILFMDSDLTNDPKSIADFVKKIPGGYDCVKATRYSKGGKLQGIPIKRKIFSVAGSFVARNLFRIGIADCTNGFRMVKLSKLKNLHFKENNFSIILEELYYFKKMHATFFEIPATLTTRKEGKTHFVYTPRLLYDYLKYSLKAFFIKT